MFPVFLSAGSWERNPNNGYPRQEVLVAAGSFHGLAIKNGIVYAWGQNDYGQLGIVGGSIQTPTPVIFYDKNNQPLNPQPQIVAVAAGGNHSLALSAAGEVWAWGDNTHGQSGFGSEDLSDPIPHNSFTPAIVTTPNKITFNHGNAFQNIIAISAGRHHSLMLHANGNIWSIGWNNDGQLGFPNKNDDLGLEYKAYNTVKCIQVENYQSWKFNAISCGDYHSIGIMADGTLWAWGVNNNGQLGQGYISSPSFLPIPVLSAGMGSEPIKNIVAISSASPSCYDLPAPAGHNLALQSDGTVLAWGYNEYGQINPAYNSYLRYESPIVVPNLTNVVAVAAGAEHSIALKADGTVASWGQNNVGQLGDGDSFQSYSIVTVLHPEILTATITAGCNFNIALKADGTLFGWGANELGQTGTQCMNCFEVVTPMPIIPFWDILHPGVLAISAGSRHSVVLKADGKVYVFGQGFYGQIGDNNIAGNGDMDPDAPPGTHSPYTSRPVMRKISDTQYEDLTNVIAIASGGYFNLALTADGKVWAWGENEYGQCGRSIANPPQIPRFNFAVPVQDANGDLSNIVAISAGLNHGLAVSSNGKVMTWGSNSDQLNKDVTLQLGHLQYYSLSDMWNISMHEHAGFIVNEDGTNISATTNVLTVAGGITHSLVLFADGTVQSCGANDVGQLGNSNFTTTAVLQTVDYMLGDVPVTLPNVKSIAANHAVVDKYPINSYSLALSAGTVYSWGFNGNGELGQGSIDQDNFTNYATAKAVNVGTIVPSASKIAAGAAFAFAGMSNGSICSWGNDQYGQLGIPKYDNGHQMPGRLTTGGTWKVINSKFQFTMPNLARTNYGNDYVSNAQKVAGGGFQSMAVMGDWQIMTAGANYYGETGHEIHVPAAIIADLPYADFFDYPTTIPFLPKVLANNSGGSEIIVKNTVPATLGMSFPNPTQQGNLLHIQPVAEKRQMVTVNIKNMLGSVVFTSSMMWNGKGNDIEIPTSSLSPGVYAVTVRSSDIVETYTFMVIH